VVGWEGCGKGRERDLRERVTGSLIDFFFFLNNLILVAKGQGIRLALIPNETNKVRHAQIIQNIWNIVIKSIWTNIYVIRMNSKMITIENEGLFIYPRRGALNQ
jgi:hypothetical protein